MVNLCRLKRSVAAAAALAVVFGGLWLRPARAAGPFSVNTHLDNVDVAPGDGVCANSNGLCSLRAAVMEANALAGADVILLRSNTYTLLIPGSGNASEGTLDVTDDLTIEGTGWPVIEVGAAFSQRAFLLVADRLEISGVIIRDGNTTADGGLVFNAGGELVITNSILRDGQANDGGGLYQTGVAASTRLVASLVLENNADQGAGVYIHSGTLELVNSILQRNHASEYGGGLYLQDGTASLDHSNLISNTAGSDDGGGFYLHDGTLTLLDSQVLTNTAGLYGGGGYNYHGTLWITRTLIGGNQTVIGFGGGLYNSGSGFAMYQSTVSDNQAPSTGGGLFNSGISLAYVERSSFTSNLSGSSGRGIATHGTLFLVNSTLSHNRADADGGGLYVIDSTSYAHLYNVTIAHNEADDDYNGSGQGGGVVSGGTLTARNTLIANNTNGINPLHHPPPPDDCFGTLTFLDYSLLETITDCTIANDNGTNKLELDPKLGVLLPHNGAPATHALLPGSPAIDAGNAAGCYGPFDLILSTDQRGQPRHADGNSDGTARCDIGAFEVVMQLWLPLMLR